MKRSIQNKINGLKTLAKISPLEPSPKKSSSTAGDSLAGVIRTQKEADAFMADLETAIKQAIDQSLAQVKAGKTTPHDEVMKKYRKWQKK